MHSTHKKPRSPETTQYVPQLSRRYRFKSLGKVATVSYLSKVAGQRIIKSRCADGETAFSYLCPVLSRSCPVGRLCSVDAAHGSEHTDYRIRLARTENLVGERDGMKPT